jgi:GNAT superfamily N-acetyltransferase
VGAAAIRRATERDADGIRRCLGWAFESFRAAYPAEAFEDTVLAAPDRVEARMSSSSLWVAVEERGEVVGTIGWSRDGDAGHIRGMAVLPGRQGDGLAARLLAVVEEDIRRAGCRRATLGTTQVLARAIAFYEKHGYRRDGPPTDFFGIPLFGFSKPLV